MKVAQIVSICGCLLFLCNLQIFANPELTTSTIPVSQEADKLGTVANC